MTRQLRIGLLAAAAIAALGLPGTSASAEPGRDLDYGFVEDQFADGLLSNPDPAIAEAWWDRAADTNASVMRINLYWGQIAGTEPPADPTDPSDPSYDWSLPDAAVRNAEERGIDVIFSVTIAPRWAEGPDRPSEEEARIGTWKPDPVAYGQFAEALSRRYSGDFEDLPRVKYFEAWNEPNLPQYLTPQWDGTEPVAPETYRELLNAFYAGVKSASPRAQVVTAGTSPFGDEPGGKRMRPYYFWREVFCLTGREELEEDPSCAGTGRNRAHFDIYAHNPINGAKGLGPTSRPPHPDEGVPSNFEDLTAIVDAALEQETILPVEEKPGWATETWYESNPPEKRAVSLAKQARFMQEALYVLWRQGVETVIFLQLRDAPYDPDLPPLVGFQTGVYLPNGEAKPALAGVRFPFVVDRRSETEALLWGIAPQSGELRVAARDGEPLAELRVEEGEVFERAVELPEQEGELELRATVGDSESLYWSLEQAGRRCDDVPASARTRTTAFENNPGGSQYLPSLPQGAGARPELHVLNEAPDRQAEISAETVERLESVSGAGADVAAVAAATAPKSDQRDAAAVSRPAGQSERARGRSSCADDSVAGRSAPVSATLTLGSGSRIGAGYPLLLIAILGGALGTALARRRARRARNSR